MPIRRHRPGRYLKPLSTLNKEGEGASPMRQTQRVKTGVPTATKGLNMDIRNKARDG